jgi:type II secretory pathway predicted ATPase ExeA
MSRILTRRAFGLPAEPWDTVRLHTADQTRVDTLVSAALRTRDRAGRRTPPAMIQIVGERGSGKSCAVSDALSSTVRTDRQGQAEPVHIIHVQRLYKERVTIADIELAILTDLPRPASERISTRGEIRSRQLARAMGQADRSGPVVVVIEEGHRMHRSTLSALKSLRELRHGVDDRLCGVILIGQRDALAGNAEVALRSDTMDMQGLIPSEIEQALSLALGQTCEPAARSVFALAPAARNWLGLQDLADQALGLAQAAGRKAVNQADATRVTHAGLRELAKAAGATQTEIADYLTETTGQRVSDSQVSRLLSGERQDPDKQARITDLLLSKLGGTALVQASAGGR